MVLSVEHNDQKRQPIRFSVEIQRETYSAIVRLLEENGIPPTINEITDEIARQWRTGIREKLLNAQQEKRVEMDALLREVEVELRIVERSSEFEGDEQHRPTLDELMEMPPEERRPHLERAAALLEDEYLNNPELTITADATELYDYPEN